MKPSALSPADVEHFIAHGFVQLPNCFDTAPGSVAHRWVEESWARNGISPVDRATWPNDKIHMPNAESVAVRDFAPRAFAAMCELCGGEDRILSDVQWGNGFIANYGWGRDKEWTAPSAEAPGWHKDGDFFLHFLDSPEQALLVVVLFSDIHPRGGGTFIACDSVAPIARHLAAHPEGVEPNKFPWKDMIHQCTDFRETTGNAGDVFLLHPYLLHASSFNHRPEARLMINPCLFFHEPMCFDRRANGSAYSPVEKSVLHALGVEHYDFQPTAPRRKIIPERIARQQKLQEQEKERLAAKG
ncbi:MAG: phytanoyl-CoA dioxygenase family protein [Chthoniobacteraceae bacterium]